MAAATGSGDKVSSVGIRMYRPGTGDCFLLQYKNPEERPVFNMMIDFGCIKGAKADFQKILLDIRDKIQDGAADKDAKVVIDLLVVTHQHADHINGFEKCVEEFRSFIFKKVWFAWTEDDTDPVANDYRRNFSELGTALHGAVTALNQLVDKNYYDAIYMDEDKGHQMVEGKKLFIRSLTTLNELNPVKKRSGEPLPTMEALLREYNVIGDGTEVEFLEPGDFRTDLPDLTGIRFYVLGPPRERKFLNKTEADGETFDQREEKSNIDFAFLSAMGALSSETEDSRLPFGSEYELRPGAKMEKFYKEGGDWRKIDHDWLFSAGSLAMRYERSINNTSLALAIQFEESGRVLLFPGDAEWGNWDSWHQDLEWPVKIDGKIVRKKIDYLLNNTVFYKVGHHMSQNGTAKRKGIEMMTAAELTAMATLDFTKINDGWLNTMPNDLLGAELIRKTEGKLFFVGDCRKILQNIKTERVVVKKNHEKTLLELNDKFNGKAYVDCIISA